MASVSVSYFRCYFNSQPHKEADEIRTVKIYAWTHFNSQPHKEADFGEAIKYLKRGIISTHSLTRRLTDMIGGIEEAMNISTHSLTRRLTLKHKCLYAPNLISTHSLTRRLTQLFLSIITGCVFQLTASQGG